MITITLRDWVRWNLCFGEAVPERLGVTSFETHGKEAPGCDGWSYGVHECDVTRSSFAPNFNIASVGLR